MRIYKYELDRENIVNLIKMPQGAKVLCFKMQGNVPCIWAMVDIVQASVERKFAVVGTGWDFDPAGLEYVGTVIDGIYVWHLFEKVEELTNIKNAGFAKKFPVTL